MYIQSPGVLKWLDFLNWFFVKDYPSCHFKDTLSTYSPSLFQDNFLFSFLSGISKSNPITFCIDFDTTYSQHSFSFSFSFDSDESDGTPTPVPATSPAKLAICQIKFTTARAEHLNYWQQKGVGCPKGGRRGIAQIACQTKPLPFVVRLEAGSHASWVWIGIWKIWGEIRGLLKGTCLVRLQCEAF